MHKFYIFLFALFLLSAASATKLPDNWIEPQTNRTPFMQACKENNYEQIQEIVTRWSSDKIFIDELNRRDDKGVVALVYAIAANQIDIVKRYFSLIKIKGNGAFFNALTTDDALIFVIKQNNKDVANIILSYKGYNNVESEWVLDFLLKINTGIVIDVSEVVSIYNGLKHKRDFYCEIGNLAAFNGNEQLIDIILEKHFEATYAPYVARASMRVDIFYIHIVQRMASFAYINKHTKLAKRIFATSRCKITDRDSLNNTCDTLLAYAVKCSLYSLTVEILKNENYPITMGIFCSALPYKHDARIVDLLMQQENFKPNTCAVLHQALKYANIRVIDKLMAQEGIDYNEVDHDTGGNLLMSFLSFTCDETYDYSLLDRFDVINKLLAKNPALLHYKNTQGNVLVPYFGMSGSHHLNPHLVKQVLAKKPQLLNEQNMGGYYPLIQGGGAAAEVFLAKAEQNLHLIANNGLSLPMALWLSGEESFRKNLGTCIKRLNPKLNESAIATLTKIILVLVYGENKEQSSLKDLLGQITETDLAPFVPSLLLFCVSGRKEGLHGFRFDKFDKEEMDLLLFSHNKGVSRINYTDFNGYTAFTIAILSLQTRSIERLLDFRVNAYAQDVDHESVKYTIEYAQMLEQGIAYNQAQQKYCQDLITAATADAATAVAKLNAIKAFKKNDFALQYGTTRIGRTYVNCISRSVAPVLQRWHAKLILNCLRQEQNEMREVQAIIVNASATKPEIGVAQEAVVQQAELEQSHEALSQLITETKQTCLDKDSILKQKYQEFNLMKSRIVKTLRIGLQ